MKKKKLWLLYPLVCLLLVFGLAIPAAATAFPAQSFYGDLTIDTVGAPAGTEVIAKIAGTEYDRVITVTVGEYGRGLDPKPLVQGEIEDGTIIDFYVTSSALGLFEVKTNETAPFEDGGTTELNLTVGELAQYTLTVDSSTGGSVTTPGEGIFTRDAGAVVNLVATPVSGYEFLNWTGDVGTVANVNLASTTITMNGNYSITANFAEIGVMYTLTLDSSTGGSVTTPGEGTLSYNAGAVVTLRAVADAGYQFVNWTGDVTTVADVNLASTTITMNGNYTITANFVLIGVTYNLTMAVVGAGTVTPAVGDHIYAANTVVAIVATPVSGYQFVNWTGDVGDVANVTAASTTITMNGDYSITANFVEIGVFFNLTVTSTAGGLVTGPGVGIHTYAAGYEVSLVVVPDAGYRFVNWTGDVTTVGDVTALSTSIFMNSNYSIQANFEVIPTYTLTVASTTGGSVTTPGEGAFPYIAETVVNLVATPVSGYGFVNWTGDVTTVANLSFPSTTITMNGNYTILATFALSLGDRIDATPPGGTLLLGPGTYSGDVTIDKSMTITGTEGETIISGSITIAALTDSGVTLENLIITDYTDFGIRIVKVRSVDNFTIRNNTILGVGGSVVGIKVDEVVTGGILTIRHNAISGNQVGIKLLAPVSNATIQFNDITSNTIGLELVGGAAVSAEVNWWGDISGPEEANWNPGGIGNAVVGNIPSQDYQPWLTRQFQTVRDDNIAYYGMAIVSLGTGWNIISTPIALDAGETIDGVTYPGSNTWAKYVALGDGLSTHPTSPAYAFDPTATEPWVALTGVDANYPLEPGDAIYVRMASDDIAAILYSPDVSVPAKQLYTGWNLVSLAWLPASMEDVYGLPADEALISVAEVPGGLTGYVLVVSPSVNPYEQAWTYTAGQTIDPWTDPNLPPPDGWMMPTSGYWVFMLNDGILAGFTFTPVSLGGG